MINSVVEAVFRYADTQPDKLCLVDDFGQVTYLQYRQKIQRYAACFRQMGLKATDRVVVEAQQTIDYLAIQLALQLQRVIFVPTEHNCAAQKIASIADSAEARVIVACKSVEYDRAQVYTYDQLQALSETAEYYIPQTFPSRDDLAEILFSTGTTGKEKGIVLNHANNIALAENVIHGVEMEKDNVELIPSPMNHSHGLRRYYANMYNGCTVLLLGSVMNIMRFFQLITQYGVNSMDLVPTALSVVLKLSKNKLGEYRDQIRYIQLGAAPKMEADQKKICELLPNSRLYNFYGSTESGCICIYNFNRPDSKKHCIGKPAYNATITIVDDERQVIESSSETTGLLASAGGMNMVGYWKDEEETRKVLVEGIVYTNDVAYFDEDGDIILLGRKGDVINVGGNKVSPDEIENTVKTMPGIADCGVIPVADAVKGNVPKLFVQLKPGTDFDPVAIRSFLAKKLEPYKIPEYIVQIDKIPRSFNGKLLRKELK